MLTCIPPTPPLRLINVLLTGISTLIPFFYYSTTTPRILKNMLEKKRKKCLVSGNTMHQRRESTPLPEIVENKKIQNLGTRYNQESE